MLEKVFSTFKMLHFHIAYLSRFLKFDKEQEKMCLDSPFVVGFVFSVSLNLTKHLLRQSAENQFFPTGICIPQESFGSMPTDIYVKKNPDHKLLKTESLQLTKSLWLVATSAGSHRIREL